MPRLDDILGCMSQEKIFSRLDALSGYYQIEMEEGSIEKTAFGCRAETFEFLRMPFGLVNAPATFQRAMDNILREEKWKHVVIYLDDIVIFSKTEEEHKIHVDGVLKKLEAAGITLNKKKCEFFKKEIMVLGHVLDGQTIKPSLEKVKAIKEARLPLTIKEMQSFLGLVNYCRKFIKDLSKEAEPLFNTIKGDRSSEKLIVSSEEEATFERVKELISEETYLKMPDFESTFVLTTDASDKAVGAVLSQIKGEKEEPVAFYSSLLNDAQKNYSATDKELLG